MQLCKLEGILTADMFEKWSAERLPVVSLECNPSDVSGGREWTVLGKNHPGGLPGLSYGQTKAG